MPSPRRLALAVLLSLLAACGGSSDDPTPPPPPVDPVNLFPNSDFSGAIENVWTFYDNAANANGSMAAVDCSADGFTGNCLQITAASYYDSALWDAAVELKDGQASPGALQIALDSAKTYEITFRARASKAAKIHLAFQTPGYAPIKAMDFDLGTSADDYTTGTFTASATPGILALQLGFAQNAGATLQIDDLQLLER
jgi:hypothetical protein